MKKRYDSIIFFVGILSFMTTQVFAMEGMVVFSNVESHPEADIVTHDTVFTIPKNGQVKVLYFGNGKSRIINGPHKGPISVAVATVAKKERMIAKFVRLLTTPQKQESFGASRGADSDNLPKNPWAVAIGQSTVPFCLPRKKAAVIARVENDKQIQVLIRNPDTDEEAILTFATSVNEVEWPSTLPITDGAQFLIKASTNDFGKLVKFKVLENDYDNEADLAFALAERNCERQALFILRKVTPALPSEIN